MRALSPRASSAHSRQRGDTNWSSELLLGFVELKSQTTVNSFINCLITVLNCFGITVFSIISKYCVCSVFQTLKAHSYTCLLATFQISILMKCFIYIISFYPCLASATRAGQGASTQAGFRAKRLLLSTQLPSVSPSQAETKLRAIFHRPSSYRYYHFLEYIVSSHCRLC